MVIANCYKGEEYELYGAKTDAEEITRALKECKFSVSLHLDLNIHQMEETFTTFLHTLNSNDHVIFYYSGHGVSYQGEQLLVPCNMDQPAKEYEIKETTFNCESAVYQIAKFARNGCKIIILDCCRSEYWNVLKGIGSRNGFEFQNISIKYEPSKAKNDQYNKNGFLDVPKRNIIRMCAASSGQTAKAGVGTALSHYTKSLLNNILTPNQSIMELNIKICSELEARNAKPEIFFTAPGDIVNDFRFKGNENE